MHVPSISSLKLAFDLRSLISEAERNDAKSARESIATVISESSALAPTATGSSTTLVPSRVPSRMSSPAPTTPVPGGSVSGKGMGLSTIEETQQQQQQQQHQELGGPSHKEIWDANASAWDTEIGASGNAFYRHLVLPSSTELLDIRPGDNILELATGNGIFARHLYSLGANVIATDISPRLIEIAKGRSTEEELKGIFYMTLDLTCRDELEGLVSMAERHSGFDAIVCNMALMDVETLEPLAEALPRLLKVGVGRFVATVQHPAFNSMKTSRVVEVGEDRATRRYQTFYSVNVQGYLDIPPMQGEAIYGQPALQWYFHRPLNELFSAFFKHGLVMDGLLEPQFPPRSRPSSKELSWTNFTQIPPILAFRFRRGDTPPRSAPGSTRSPTASGTTLRL